MQVNKNAFTLVELLVVVSIIALLIAMLLPSLTRARHQAKALKCASQLSQVGMACNLYADENCDCLPSWSNWHVWGYYRTPLDGSGDDEAGPAWTEMLRENRSLPSIDILRCPAYPKDVSVSYFITAYAGLTRFNEHTLRRAAIRRSSDFITGGDCTNPMFFHPPFGTHGDTGGSTNDADMDNATQRALDWNELIHNRRTNNVLFADNHVASYANFLAAEMTHDVVNAGVDWGEISPSDKSMD